MKRRIFIKESSMALAIIPSLNFFEEMHKTKMGIVVHSYANRWNAKESSTKYPAFTNAMELLEHCHSIHAGGIQTIVNDWSTDFSKSIRSKSDQFHMFVEGSVALPKTEDDVSEFENNIIQAKTAGIDIVRSVTLGTRRYETFKKRKDFDDFKSRASQSIQLAEPIVKKHKIKLAIENHKDFLSDELVVEINSIGSEWVGVTLDFGNNMALLEDPQKVIETLAPYAFTTHVKDMGVAPYSDGFYLAEVPLGKGVCDIKKMVEECKKYNPNIRFNLEMITRDPLEIPCKKEDYWATFGPMDETRLNQMLSLVKKNDNINLQKISILSFEGKLEAEEKNNLASLNYSRKRLGLR